MADTPSSTQEGALIEDIQTRAREHNGTSGAHPHCDGICGGVCVCVGGGQLEL